MTKQHLEKTRWAKVFKKEDPINYNRALVYALDDPLYVSLYKNDELGEMVWAINVYNTEFWMDAKKTKKEAINLCKKMGWEIIK